MICYLKQYVVNGLSLSLSSYATVTRPPYLNIATTAGDLLIMLLIFIPVSPTFNEDIVWVICPVDKLLGIHIIEANILEFQRLSDLTVTVVISVAICKESLPACNVEALGAEHAVRAIALVTA